jgi:hypothetical protein
MLRDPELKKQRGYIDPGSYVRPDGSEVLKGLDWRRRKVELWKRTNGHCQWVTSVKERDPATGEERILEFPCLSQMSDAHHIVPRSKRRDDRLTNLHGICRYHHMKLDHRKIGGKK